jgi:hypothetical protein
MFAGQAARLAEHCGRITAKEASKRESVRRQLERHLPLELLAKAGLLQEPPHCMVSDNAEFYIILSLLVWNKCEPEMLLQCSLDPKDGCCRMAVASELGR